MDNFNSLVDNAIEQMHAIAAAVKTNSAVDNTTWPVINSPIVVAEKFVEETLNMALAASLPAPVNLSNQDDVARDATKAAVRFEGVGKYMQRLTTTYFDPNTKPEDKTSASLAIRIWIPELEIPVNQMKDYYNFAKPKPSAPEPGPGEILINTPVGPKVVKLADVSIGDLTVFQFEALMTKILADIINPSN